MKLRRSASVFDKMELVGEWWLPDEPMKRCRGMLSGSTPEEFSLSLEGCFESFHDAKSNRIILGDTRDGKKVTLGQCWVRAQKNDDATYFVHWVIIGGHFPTYGSWKFSKLRFGIHLLDEWRNVRSFSPLRHEEDGSIVLKYVPPDPTYLGQNGLIKAYLDYDRSPESYTAVQTGFAIEHVSRLELGSNDEDVLLANFDDAEGVVSLFEVVGHFCAFFSLATSARVFPYDIKAYSPTISRKLPGGSSFQTPIEIYRIWRVPNPMPKLWPWDMEFTWEHVKDSPEKYFGAWLSKAESIGMPIPLYLDAVSGEHTYTQEPYIALVQALEGYHRYAYPDASKPTLQHQQKLDAICRGAPSEHITWLKEKLRYSHEPSLARRLKDLFRNQKTCIEWLLSAWKHADAWIQAIKDTRNAHAHCLGPEISVAFSKHPRERRREMLLMRAIMLRYLLHEIEFDETRSLQILKKNREFSHLSEENWREVRVVGKRKDWSAVRMGSGGVMFQSHSKQEVMKRGRAMARKEKLKFSVEREDRSVQESRDYEEAGKSLLLKKRTGRVVKPRAGRMRRIKEK